MNSIRKVIAIQIDSLPNYKLIYILRLKEYVKGIWQTIHAYGIPFSKENHEILVEMVQEKLEGPDIEREWSEDEYQNFVQYQE
jgi:hypothetical protein